jgi:hypothetical protein
MMLNGPLEIFAAMIVLHCLCDYAWQGDFLAGAKNWTTPIGSKIWPEALASHAIIQGGAVWLVTGSLLIGVLEAVTHAAIDAAKIANKISYRADQLLHVACKAVWVVLVVTIGAP